MKKRLRILLTLGLMLFAFTASAELIINEIMKDPLDYSDSYAEWFELYNDSPDSVDLAGYTIADNNGNSHVITALAVGPYDVFVLGINGNQGLNGQIELDYDYGGFTLDNGADEVILYDDMMVVVDQVWYDDGTLWPDADGASMMLIDPALDNSLPENWRLSTVAWADGDFGSPRELNEGPYTTPNLVISEIMYDPYASSDSYGEWFEVYNAGAEAANLRLWYFTDEPGASYRWVDHFFIEPGAYSIIGKNGNTGLNGNVVLDWDYSGHDLENTEDEIILTDLFGNLVDEVWYDENDGWYPTYGASIYLNDLGADNNDPTNWEMSTVAWEGSTGDFGSPGEANQAGYTIPDIVITEILYDPYASSDTYGEWFEVYNAGADSINFRLWQFTETNGANEFIPTTDYWIQPGEYFVFGKNANTGLNGNVTLDFDYSGFNMEDTFDEIVITDLRGNQIDIVEYDEEGTFPDTYGASIYLTDLEADNSLGENWNISTWAWPGSTGDFGSPGEPNQGPYTAPNLVISEIMLDPYASSDTYGEWFELYSFEPDSINLRYWDFYDNDGNSFTIYQDLWIHPGQYMIFVKNSNTGLNGNVTGSYDYGGMNLDNTTDEIIIRDHLHNIIDMVEYNETYTMHFGASIYLLDLESDNNDPVNWAISDIQWPGTMGDFGSPGQVNQVPQPTAQVVITEMMVDPLAASDTYGEWFELYNAGEDPINMRYYEFFDIHTNSFTIYEDFIIESNEYVVFGVNSNTGLNGNVDLDYDYGGLSFHDTDDELIIQDMHGVDVDVVTYEEDAGWPLIEGASMYLINPFEDNSVGTSWTSSTEMWPGSAGDFGSPGQANFEAYLIVTPIVTEVPEEGGDLVFDTRFISYLPNTYLNVRFWTEVETPDGFIFEVFSQLVTVPPFLDITVEDMTQEIPDYAPGGNYSFHAHIGYPNIFLTDSFDWTKLGLEAFGWTHEDWEGVFGDGVFTAEELPTVYKMENAYPNPFNPTTNITIALPDASDLKVMVYNINGRQVAELANSHYSAGYHHLALDASNLASGMYFVRAVVPGQLNEVQKVMLVK